MGVGGLYFFLGGGGGVNCPFNNMTTDYSTLEIKFVQFS